MALGILGETQILDYTNSQMVMIKTGSTKIQTGVFKIIHLINLDQ